MEIASWPKVFNLRLNRRYLARKAGTCIGVQLSCYCKNSNTSLQGRAGSADVASGNRIGAIYSAGAERFLNTDIRGE